MQLPGLRLHLMLLLLRCWLHLQSAVSENSTFQFRGCLEDVCKNTFLQDPKKSKPWALSHV